MVAFIIKQIENFTEEKLAEFLGRESRKMLGIQINQNFQHFQK